MTKALACVAAGLAACLCLCGGALAQGEDKYPSKPVRLVQGFGAGGNADTVARVIAEPLSQILGQPVVVEARTGAGGNIASDAVAKSSADGYTLILLTGGHAVSAGLYKSLPFNPVEDFAMISTITFFPFVVSVRPDHPAKSLQDIIQLAKAQPGKLNYSSVGIGSTQHLAGELLSAMAGIKMQHVPYRGGAAPMEGLLRGDVDLLIDTVTFTTSQLQAGRVRPLAVTSANPWPSLADVPTVAQTVPGFDVQSWTGLAAPKNTPRPVLQKLNLALNDAIAKGAVRRRLEGLGNRVSGSTPNEMRALVAAQAEKWRGVIRDAGIPQQ
jgi:tripartite-type tricarboxylate transporter receptor subunit TctC